MIRGTNQEFRCKLSCTYEDLATVRVTFWQENYNGPASWRPLPIVKVLAQCSPVGEDVLSVTLNQEETLRFTEKRKAKAQLRAVTKSGVPIATKEHLIKVYPVYDDSVLDGGVVPTPTYEDLIILDGRSII